VDAFGHGAARLHAYTRSEEGEGQMTANDGSRTAIGLSEDEALDILAFLVSAAELCTYEPTYYGTFRLIDGASRLMGHMLAHDPASADFLRRFKAEIDAKKVWMMYDRPAYVEFLRAAPAEIAAEVKAREEEAAS